LYRSFHIATPLSAVSLSPLPPLPFPRRTPVFFLAQVIQSLSAAAERRLLLVGVL
jgi:hypothetical protein